MNPNQGRSNRPLLAALTGLGSLAVGSLYIFHAYGPSESEVAQWGLVNALLGAGLLVIAGLQFAGRAGRLPGPGLMLYGATATQQIAPIALWFAFSGGGISDGSPPSAFVAHWSYSLPHLGLLALSVAGFWDEARSLMHPEQPRR